VSLLQQRKPNAPNDWVKKLPDMARRLEDSLYRTASSAEEYGNFNTLKHRLEQLTLSMGAKAAKKNASGPAQALPSTQPAAQPVQAAQPPAKTAPDGGKVLVNMQDINQAPQKPSGESSSYHSFFSSH
jgi:E1A/CREB-binding protein